MTTEKCHSVCLLVYDIIFFSPKNRPWVVELPSLKEEATFEPSSTAEFCATRGILRAPFQPPFSAQ